MPRERAPGPMIPLESGDWLRFSGSVRRSVVGAPQRDFADLADVVVPDRDQEHCRVTGRLHAEVALFGRLLEPLPALLIRLGGDGSRHVFSDPLGDELVGRRPVGLLVFRHGADATPWP